MASMIQKSVEANKPEVKANQSINTMLNGLLDGEGMRKRFNEVLGERTPQFLSSLVSMINGDVNLQEAFRSSPLSVIQSALKAATFDLPIEPSLGYAYIVPFGKCDKNTGKTTKEATFIIGYKGMIQLCLRTGQYSRIPDAVDVRAGELISYDRLTGDAVFDWIESEDERERLPIIGYAGYFRLKNGAEKTIYMSKAQIEAHEKKNRKGQYMGRGWKDDFDSMARKTIIRKLVGKYGLMSIQYQTDSSAINFTEALKDDFVDEDIIVEASTGEVIEEVAAQTAEQK